jgi:phosphatidylserine decarboxylase
VIEDAKGRRVLMRQIAGTVARRIICYAKENKEVQQGDETGFIRFGSRVDLFLPLDAEILVQPGQKVRGRISEIARFN